MIARRAIIPLWLVILIGASLVAGWTSLPWIVEWVGRFISG